MSMMSVVFSRENVHVCSISIQLLAKGMEIYNDENVHKDISTTTGGLHKRGVA